jgi:hypothetical protein
MTKKLIYAVENIFSLFLKQDVFNKTALTVKLCFRKDKIDCESFLIFWMNNQSNLYLFKTTKKPFFSSFEEVKSSTFIQCHRGEISKLSQLKTVFHYMIEDHLNDIGQQDQNVDIEVDTFDLTENDFVPQLDFSGFKRTLVRENKKFIYVS